MPSVYSPIIWNNLKIETSFLGTQRRASWWPFYVGDRVEFHIRLSRINEKSPRLTEVGVWENLPQYKKPILLAGLERTSDDMVMEADCSDYCGQIEEAGNVSYYVGYLNYFGDGKQIISADAEHRDRRNLNLVLFVVVPIITAIIVLVGTYLLQHFGNP